MQTLKHNPTIKISLRVIPGVWVSLCYFCLFRLDIFYFRDAINNHTDVFLINREFGRTWEERVSQWLQMNEQYVLDVYEYAPSKDGVTKAPKMKIFPEGKSLILPDLQVASAGATHWIEIKSKACCYSHQHTTWERSTGFDLYLWNHWKLFLLQTVFACQHQSWEQAAP